MPKLPKAPPNPIERVAPGDPRLPPGLFLPEAGDAEVLPDGRVVPLSIPPSVRAFYFPDLPRDEGVTAPSFTDAPPSAPAVPETPPVVAPEEVPATQSDAAPVPAESDPASPEPAPTEDVPPTPAVEEL